MRWPEPGPSEPAVQRSAPRPCAVRRGLGLLCLSRAGRGGAAAPAVPAAVRRGKQLRPPRLARCLPAPRPAEPPPPRTRAARSPALIAGLGRAGTRVERSRSSLPGSLGPGGSARRLAGAGRREETPGRSRQRQDPCEFLQHSSN